MWKAFGAFVIEWWKKDGFIHFHQRAADVLMENSQAASKEEESVSSAPHWSEYQALYAQSAASLNC